MPQSWSPHETLLIPCGPAAIHTWIFIAFSSSYEGGCGGEGLFVFLEMKLLKQREWCVAESRGVLSWDRNSRQAEKNWGVGAGMTGPRKGWLCDWGSWRTHSDTLITLHNSQTRRFWIDQFLALPKNYLFNLNTASPSVVHKHTARGLAPLSFIFLGLKMIKTTHGYLCVWGLHGSPPLSSQNQADFLIVPLFTSKHHQINQHVGYRFKISHDEGWYDRPESSHVETSSVGVGPLSLYPQLQGNIRRLVGRRHSWGMES